MQTTQRSRAFAQEETTHIIPYVSVIRTLLDINTSRGLFGRCFPSIPPRSLAADGPAASGGGGTGTP